MKKILLINPPGKYRYLRDQYCSSATKANYYWPAIDLLVLSGILKRQFEIAVVDAIAENLNEEEVLDIIGNDSHYAVICLSSSSSKVEDFKLFEQIKNRFGIIIVVNAGFLLAAPEVYLNSYSFIDAIIVDYTQDGIVGFFNGRDGPFPGLVYRNHDKIINDRPNDCLEPFSYPVPAHDLFPLDKYYMPQVKHLPFTCVLISTGCKYKCKFCSSAALTYKRRQISNIIEELRVIKSLGITEVHFPDFTFTADREHVLAICQAMINEKLSLSWDCLTRVDCFDEHLAHIMKQAGCHTIQFGVESKNEKVLSALGKPISNHIVRNAFSICKKTQIETIGFFIIGLPGEDEQSIRETIDFSCELDCDYASFSVFVPDFGSGLRKELEEKDPGLKNVYHFDRTKFPVLNNEYLSKEKIWQLRNKAIRQFYFRPGYILKIFKKHKNLKNLLLAFRSFLSIYKTLLIKG